MKTMLESNAIAKSRDEKYNEQTQEMKRINEASTKAHAGDSTIVDRLSAIQNAARIVQENLVCDSSGLWLIQCR